MAGVRPIPFVGAELEYLDFGSESFSPNNGAGIGWTGTARARAGGLFAVGYWPILPATLDLFARVGGERVRTTADGVFRCIRGIPLLPSHAVGPSRTSPTVRGFRHGCKL
jgi:hypothetical protein